MPASAGRAARSAAAPGPSPIIEHPDVKRMLLTMRALTQRGARHLLRDRARARSRHRAAPTPATRKAAHERASLLTPVAKAFATDIGIEVASLGVQVHGGMGYIEETGAAQHFRDARIAAIYEGTNGIQAHRSRHAQSAAVGRRDGQGLHRGAAASVEAINVSNDPAFGGPACGSRTRSTASSAPRHGC